MPISWRPREGKSAARCPGRWNWKSSCRTTGRLISLSRGMIIKILKKRPGYQRASGRKRPVIWVSLVVLKTNAVGGMAAVFVGACLTFGCTEKDKAKDYMRADIDLFLSQYDPAMKRKREELVRNLAMNQEQVSKLNSLRESYKSERAKKFVEEKLNLLMDQGRGLENLLNEIDAAVEVSIATKEMNAADAGGLKSSESRALLGQADQLIKQSIDLSSDVGDLFSHKHSEDLSASTARCKGTNANQQKGPTDSKGSNENINEKDRKKNRLNTSQDTAAAQRTNPRWNETGMPGERFPETRMGELSPGFVQSLSKAQLRYAINEMFARHGATFVERDIASVFRSKDWYVARKGLSFNHIEQSMFSDVERRNLLVLAGERERRASQAFDADQSRLIENGSGGVQFAIIDDQDGWSNLRAGPDLGARIVRRIYSEEIFQVTERNGEWLRVVTDQREAGWMHTSVVRFTTNN